jgi:hypothetical protein
MAQDAQVRIDERKQQTLRKELDSFVEAYYKQRKGSKSDFSWL